ncbi:MAG: hypothetical protein SNJ57_04885 [Cyanobacteriota bacterium]
MIQQDEFSAAKVPNKLSFSQSCIFVALLGCFGACLAVCSDHFWGHRVHDELPIQAVLVIPAIPAIQEF